MTAVPPGLRPAVGAELERLVAGELPHLLTWVRDYGDDGATLVPQPDAIWDHPGTDAVLTVDGSWALALPLWTTQESPSDLSAHVTVSADGTVTIEDVHVL